LKGEERIGEDLASIQEALKKRGCAHFLMPEQIKWISYFQIHRRMVHKMRIGNCFLAGDAAHIHSPAGGQGMNTSIQDAFNLAWKLSLVAKDMARDQLLDSYEKERLPVAKKVLDGTTRFTQLLGFVQNRGFFSPFFLLLFFIKTFFRRRVVRSLAELSFVYKKSFYIHEPIRDLFWGGPKSGERAPNVHLENGKDFFWYLNSLSPILLLFEENPVLKGEGFEILVINDSNLKKAYKGNKKSVYFIRPDGVIGYRSRCLKVGEVKSYLLKIFNNL
jgi:hypothetical protein